MTDSIERVTQLRDPFFVVTIYKENIMFEFEVKPEVLVAVFAAVTAFVFEYAPKVKDWFDAKSETAKKQIVLGSLVVEVAVIFAGTCAGIFITGLVCDVKSAFDLLYMVLIAVGVNQGTHLLTKRSAKG